MRLDRLSNDHELLQSEKLCSKPKWEITRIKMYIKSEFEEICLKLEARGLSDKYILFKLNSCPQEVKRLSALTSINTCI